MSSGPPPSDGNSSSGGEAPSPPALKTSGATIDDAVNELRELVKLSKAQYVDTGRLYQIMTTNKDSGQSGLGSTTRPSSRGEFGEHWQGVEGQMRRTAAGFKTFADSFEAVVTRLKPIKDAVAETPPGKWLSDTWEKGTDWAQKKYDAFKETTIGSVLDKVAKGFMAVIDTAAGLVMAFVKARDAADRWTDQYFQRAAKYAEVSGSMAGVIAERQIHDMMRDVERGERTAGTARELMQAESRRKDGENKIGTLVDNTSNRLLSLLNNLISQVTGPLGTLSEKADEWFKKVLGEDPGGDPVSLASTMADVNRIVEKDDADKRRMMEAARTAGMGARGLPAASVPVGGLPR